MDRDYWQRTESLQISLLAYRLPRIESPADWRGKVANLLNIVIGIEADFGAVFIIDKWQTGPDGFRKFQQNGRPMRSLAN